MMNYETIIEKKIQYQEVDATGQYRLSNLFSALADLATENAMKIGIWDDELGHQYGWILTKQTIQLKRAINIHETIYISTRPGKSSRIQFTRHYDIYDSNKQLIGGVYSVWTFLDLEQRKIVQPKSIGIEIPQLEPFTTEVEKYIPIKKEVPLAYVMDRKVRYSDIDINQHMSNFRYIEWAMDAIDISHLEKHSIVEVSVIYKKEMSQGTETKIFVGQADQYFKIQIKDRQQEIVYFEMGVILS